MHYLALATDYDGTLAHHGLVDEATLAALERVLASGRKLILVTGRELEDLLGVFPQIGLFEWVVAENGALLYRPSDRSIKPLAEPPPHGFVEALAARGVQGLSVGRTIVATWQPHEIQVLEVIREMGLELKVVFNKGAVMVLPSSVNKATGLMAALDPMCLSPHNVVGVGDAENDHAFLSICECAVAVANALPSLKERADLVTIADHGRGVAELIDQMVADDLEQIEPRLARHHLVLGARDDREEVRIPSRGVALLIAGASGSGKSTAATALVERAIERHYQCVIIDPEGDYDDLERAAVLGNSQRAPTIDEVLNLLAKPSEHVVVNLIGLKIADRPSFFLSLLPRLQEMRARTGRPHWIVVDEAHHVLPATWEPGEFAMPQDIDRVMWITVDPALVAPAALATVNRVVAAGPSATTIFVNLARMLCEPPPTLPHGELERGELLVWRRGIDASPEKVRLEPGEGQRRRHRRKYAEGELPPDRSFFFCGPENKLNLRAQNLINFAALADGVDDETWQYHLERGDYAQWFRERIKDEELAVAAEAVQKQAMSAAESRHAIKAAIEDRYTLPAAPPMPMPGTDAAGQYQSEEA